MFINANFSALSTEQEFLEMTEENLISIMKSDDITISDEKLVFETMMVWINHDLENRKEAVCKFY